MKYRICAVALVLTFFLGNASCALGADILATGGSVVTDSDKYPWQGAIVSKAKIEAMKDHECGGTLIHPRWILTAAHCFVDENLSLEVPVHNLAIVGEKNLLGKSYDADGDLLIVHELYGSEFNTYDVALLRLFNPIPNVAPVAISNYAIERQHVVESKFAISLGWGLTDPSDPESKSPDLVEVKPPIVSRQECIAVSEAPVSEMMICAGDPKNGIDTCGGDSGGGLFVVTDATEDLTQVGIVSHGPPECGKDGFGKYMRVSVVRDWIERKLNTYGDSLNDELVFECTDENRKRGFC